MPTLCDDCLRSSAGLPLSSGMARPAPVECINGFLAVDLGATGGSIDPAFLPTASCATVQPLVINGGGVVGISDMRARWVSGADGGGVLTPGQWSPYMSIDLPTSCQDMIWSITSDLELNLPGNNIFWTLETTFNGVVSTQAAGGFQSPNLFNWTGQVHNRTHIFRVPANSTPIRLSWRVINRTDSTSNIGLWNLSAAGTGVVGIL